MNAHTYALGTDQSKIWRQVLARCRNHDIYHLPEYHMLAEEQEGSQAILFVCETSSSIVAMPILLNEISQLPGIDSLDYRDATSVYGYPGPISDMPSPQDKILYGFQSSLKDYLDKRNVVSAFSRLNPLLDQRSFLKEPFGQVIDIGRTVAIDLSLSRDAQYGQYRSNHRRDIRKAKREGVKGFHDTNWRHFDTFIELYYETMRRAGASDFYFFDRAYFKRLRELLGDHLHLFVAVKDKTVIAGALFTLCNSIIQYHLGGTDSRYLGLSPSKLIFDTVRLWAIESGARIFHLGGGVGSKEDSLFRFKKGFSEQLYPFSIWRLIVNESIYDQLVQKKRVWNAANGLQEIDECFFPAYRCPTRPISN